MDNHLDWFAPGSKDADDEVSELVRMLSSGGFVLWRSAARQPWYQEVYVDVIHCVIWSHGIYRFRSHAFVVRHEDIGGEMFVIPRE